MIMSNEEIIREYRAEFIAALSSEFIKMTLGVLPAKAAAQFLLIMAEEAAKRACEGMEMPV